MEVQLNARSEVQDWRAWFRELARIQVRLPAVGDGGGGGGGGVGLSPTGGLKKKEPAAEVY